MDNLVITNSITEWRGKEKKTFVNTVCKPIQMFWTMA